MAVSREEIIEVLSNMSVLEVTQLVSELEEKWGVSAAAPVAVAAAGPAAEAAAAEEKRKEEAARARTSKISREHAERLARGRRALVSSGPGTWYNRGNIGRKSLLGA